MAKGKGSKRKKRDSGEELEGDSDVEGASRHRARSGRGGKTSQSKGKRDRHDLNLVLAQDEAEASRNSSICWSTVKAGPSYRPIRMFCCVCGFPANFRCLECSSHRPTAYYRCLCSRRCVDTHRDTDCCKPRNLTQW